MRRVRREASRKPACSYDAGLVGSRSTLGREPLRLRHARAKDIDLSGVAGGGPHRTLAFQPGSYPLRRPAFLRPGVAPLPDHPGELNLLNLGHRQQRGHELSRSEPLFRQSSCSYR
jgi:hypothetical protein